MRCSPRPSRANSANGPRRAGNSRTIFQRGVRGTGWCCRVSRSEESEVGEELGGGIDDLAGGLHSFSGLAGAGLLGRVVRVFKFVASAAQPAEGSQAGAELGADGIVNGLVAAGRGGAQALLGEQGDASLPGGIVSEDDAAIGCRLHDQACQQLCRAEGSGRLIQTWLQAAGRGPRCSPRPDPPYGRTSALPSFAPSSSERRACGALSRSSNIVTSECSVPSSTSGSTASSNAARRCR